MSIRPPAFEPIAVVGMACRFPGGANDPDRFWRLLLSGADASVEIPPERWNADRYYDPRPNAPGKAYVRRASFLSGVDIRDFDAGFFGIPPVEARTLDPQHRLLLEVSWEAIEDAGIPNAELSELRAGVFIGMMNHEFDQMLVAQGAEALDAYCETGTGFDMASGRISYMLDLRGPNIAVHTACSSSLVALHLACRSLQNAECGIALVGGVNVLLNGERMVRHSRMLAVSPDGRSKAFDAAADGFGRGEGCGMVVLKPLAHARADGDRIMAVVRQTAVNHGGRATGLTVPSASAQEDLVRSALERARVDPADVSYFETHGTGTPVGDPIEFASIAAVLREGRSPDRPLFLGSVKTNIGHLEAGAGVAGLIKILLSLRHGTIPPHLHLNSVNPAIDLDLIPARIPSEPTEWRAGDGPRLAGINSFGMGGTNAFALIEEAPDPTPAASEAGERPQASDGVWLLPLSARSPEALVELAARFGEVLASPSMLDDATLRDVCVTAARGRTHHVHRIAVLGESREQLAEHLRAAPASGREGPPRRSPRVAFVFGGHGSQWPGMGRELFETEPVFRASLEACDEALRPHLVGFSVLDLLTAPTPDPLSRVQRVQPAIFAVQLSLAALWRSWGVEPAAVAGHSMSEVLAAHLAGALDLDEAARLVALRARLLGRASELGGMLAVGLPWDDAERLLEGTDGRVSLAGRNGPRSTVLAGDLDVLDRIRQRLEIEGVFARDVNSDVAMHSHQLDPLLDDMREGVAGLRCREASLPLYSTVTGARASGTDLDADHWVASLRAPVLLEPTVRQMLADGYDVLLEVSPHPILGRSLEECVEAFGGGAVVVPSLRRNDSARSALLSSLGSLYSQGVDVSWPAVYPGSYRRLPLPMYPWQRQRHWNERLSDSGEGPRRRVGGHPLQTRHVRPSTDPGTHVWEVDVSVADLPWLADHRVHGNVVFPGAAFLEMALVAARQVHGETAFLEDVTFEQALVVPEDGSQTIQLILRVEADGRSAFSFHSFATSVNGSEPPRQSHASGSARTGWATVGSSEQLRFSEDRLAERTEGVRHYEAMAQRGYGYGPRFRGVGSLWRHDREAGATLDLPDAVVFEADEYAIHPAVLDACLQVVAGLVPPQVGERDTLLPVQVGRMILYRSPDLNGPLRVVARSVETDAGASATMAADLVLYDDRGRPVIEVQGLVLRWLSAPPQEAESWSEWTWELTWRLEERRPVVPAGAGAAEGPWLLVADAGGVANALADLIRERGERCAIVDPARMDETLTRALERAAPRRIVLLNGLDLDGDAILEGAERAAVACDSVVRLVQAIESRNGGAPPQLTIVTRGAQQPSADPGAPLGAAALWGLGRTLALEHPELGRRNLDLALGGGPADAETMLHELVAGSGEDEVALRADGRYVARLAPWRPAIEPRFAPAGERPFRLVPSPSGLVDRVALCASSRQRPTPGEIEIEVEAAALNFRDVLLALGMLPTARGEDSEPIFGLECAGRVVGVGEGVTEFRVGDRVAAIAWNALSRFVTTAAYRAAPQPATLSAAQASALMSVYGTAMYAFDITRLRAGERVLIHAGAGGVGLAAIHLARRLGAEVFATAGRPDKREFLGALGVEHVMDSRSLTWADEVMEATGGRGMDVVLNSLGGEAIARGVACLAPFGRFVEIGKRDIYADLRLGLLPFRNNLTYVAVDLLGLDRERPEELAVLVRRVMSEVGEGSLPPLPVTEFPVSKAASAIAMMQRAEHIGKVVLSMRDPDAMIEVPASVGGVGTPIRADATYLVTGGFGGLGLVTARWLVDRGARSLALMGRSAPAGEALAAVRALEARGVQVLVATGDVARRADLARVASQIDAGMPTLRGVFHAAGVLDDSPLTQITPERFERVVAPKIRGSWNLHALTKGRPIDVFVLYSSIASMVGSMAQGSYAAGNAFMDALAHHRRARGLPALAINWGPWSDVGMAARLDSALRKRLDDQGMSVISPDRGARLLDRILGARESPPQVGVFQIDWSAHRKAVGVQPSVLLDAPAGENGSSIDDAASPDVYVGALGREVAGTPLPLRVRVVTEHVARHVASTLGYPPSHTLDVRTQFSDLGLDSLRAMDLRNRLAHATGHNLRSMVAFEHPTIFALAQHVLGVIQPGAAAVGDEVDAGSEARSDAAKTSAEVDDGALAERVAALSDTEIESALEEKLRRLLAD